MKKTFLYFLLSGMLTFFLAFNAAWGETIPISCTIPSIPGVNVPLIEEQSIKTAAQASKEEKQQIQEEKNTASTQDQNLIRDNSHDMNTALMIKTLYDR